MPIKNKKKIKKKKTWIIFNKKKILLNKVFEIFLIIKLNKYINIYINK